MKPELKIFVVLIALTFGAAGVWAAEFEVPVAKQNGKVLEYQGEVWTNEGAFTSGPWSAARYVNGNRRIDILWFNGVLVMYAIMLDPAAYERDKCDPANFILLDTNCDGVMDTKAEACATMADVGVDCVPPGY